MLAVTTGMRQGELLGLRWEDVDLAGGTLQVRRTLSTRAGRGFSFSPPKTAKGRRSTKLPEVAKKRSLKKHRKAQLEERMKLTGLWEDNGLVFATRLGTPVGRQELVMRSFKPLLIKAGSGHPLPRPETHVRDPAARQGCTRQIRAGTLGPRHHLDHAGYLLSRPTRHGRCGRGSDGRGLRLIRVAVRLQ